MRARFGVFLIAVLGLSLSGCFFSQELSRVRGELQREAGFRTSSGFEANFGPVSMWIARGFIGRHAGNSGDLASLALRHVRRVKVGVYKLERPLDSRQVAMPATLRRYTNRGGWEHLGTFREDDQAVWVLYRARNEEIRDLFVVVLGEEELVMTRLTGNLTEAVMTYLRENPVDLPTFVDTVAGDEAALEAAAEAVLQ
jgi:hypothetical protein